MKKDKNKKPAEENNIVKEAQKLGGVIVCERPCYKQYECEKCIQEKQK